MGWQEDLRTFDWKIVPIERWPGEPTKSRQRSRFDSPWGSTMGLLADELRHLSAREILLQIAITKDDLRLDGWVRANAYPSHPGVILTFESKKIGRTLSYPCDTFDDWKANVRAIALALEALRKVERYGVTRRGEQYQGWAQLPPAGGSSSTMTAQVAARVLVDAARNGTTAEVILRDRDAFLEAYRKAAKRTHPDAGGNVRDFQVVSEAKGVLERHFGGAT